MQAGFRSASSRIMLREFFAWWCAQLADLLPQELRRSALGTGDALVITPIGRLGQGVEAVAVDQRQSFVVEGAHFPPITPAPVSCCRRHRPETELR